MSQILALYLDLEGTKNIHVIQVLIWGFDGGWRFLTEVLHLDLDTTIFQFLALSLHFEGAKSIYIH